MKIRTGFVSNSSSSSFCIIGMEKSVYPRDNDELREEIFLRLLKSIGWYDLKDNYLRSGEWETVINNHRIQVNGYDDQLGYIGQSIGLFSKDKTINTMIDEVTQFFSSLIDMDIPKKYIDLYYGKCGSG